MSRPPRWTDTELGHLQAFYHAISAKRLVDLIPERSPSAIKKKAWKVGLRKCHERLREAGRETINVRWGTRVFKTPETPEQ